MPKRFCQIDCGKTFAGFHFYSRLTTSGRELSIVIIHNIGDKGFYPVIFSYYRSSHCPKTDSIDSNGKW